MKANPKVSVIITTKNEEKNIIKCLRSIKNQDYPGKTETILVDNHSEDKTVNLAKLYVSKTIIAGKERSNQRNIGAKAASGSWLLFIDADMELSKGVISGCVDKIKNEAAMIAILQFYRGFNFWGKALALEQNCYGEDINLLTAARFFKKDLFLKLGGFNTKLLAGEDWDLTQRLLKKGIKIIHLKKDVIFHDEPKLSFFGLLKKESYYIRYMDRYAKKNPSEFAKQSSVKYRTLIWLKSWKKLIRHPLLTLTFLFYKFVVWVMWRVQANTHSKADPYFFSL